MKNKYYENQLSLIKSGNTNVSSEGDGKVFVKFLFLLIFIIIILSFCFDYIAGIIIDNMPVETQLKIESLFTVKSYEYKDKKYKNEIEKLNNIKIKIIKNDKTLQNKSNFPIIILKDIKINAMINPGGVIYITSGLLDKNFSEQELAFVLAHELGHYAHKDHLKSISKKIFYIFLCLFIGQNDNVYNAVKGITETDTLYHSRNNEKEADLYAGKMLIKIYGSNQGGIQFMQKLKKNENLPEFSHYFSTHPAIEKRLNILKNQKSLI